MVKNQKQFNIILIIITAVIFIVACFALAMLGLNIYRTASSDSARSDMTEACDYIRTELRQCENGADIRIASLNGSVPSLVITTHGEGSDTELWLFAYDGYLRSISAHAGESISPITGDKLVPVKSLDFELIDKDLLEVAATSDDGDSAAMNLRLPGIGGGDE